MALETEEKIKETRNLLSPYLKEFGFIKDDVIEEIRKNLISDLGEADCLIVMLSILKDLEKDANTGYLLDENKQLELSDLFLAESRNHNVSTLTFANHISQVFLESWHGLQGKKFSGLQRLQNECHSYGKQYILEKLNAIANGAVFLKFDKTTNCLLWAEFELWLRLTMKIIKARSFFVTRLEGLVLRDPLPSKDELSRYYVLTATSIRNVLDRQQSIKVKDTNNSSTKIVNAITASSVNSSEKEKVEDDTKEVEAATNVIPIDKMKINKANISELSASSIEKEEVGSEVKSSASLCSSNVSTNSFELPQHCDLLSSIVYKKTETLSPQALYSKMLVEMERCSLDQHQLVLLRPIAERTIKVLKDYVNAYFTTFLVPTLIKQRTHTPLIEGELKKIFPHDDASMKLTRAEQLDNHINNLHELTSISLIKFVFTIWEQIANEASSELRKQLQQILEDCRTTLEIEIESVKKAHVGKP